MVLVPSLYLLFSMPALSGMHLDPGSHVVVAHATSLFVIIPTAIVGTVSYHRAGLIEWRVVFPMAAGAIVGSVLGARLAVDLPSEVLKGMFGAVLVVVGARLLRPSTTPAAERGRRALRTHPALGGLLGVAVGLLSALLGVGGGLLAIPFLIYVVRLEIGKVASSSLAIVIFAALGGVIGYTVLGWGNIALPPTTLGYVLYPAGLAMVPGAVFSVRWGARINQRMGVRLLHSLFALFFIILGLRFAAGTLAHLLATP